MYAAHLLWIFKSFVLLISYFITIHRAAQNPSPVCTFLLQLYCQSARRTHKINSLTNQKGYDNFETTVGKISVRRIQICFYCFCKINFWLFFWNKWIQGPNKNSQSRFGFASSNTLVPRSQTLLRCLGLLANYFSWFRKSSWSASAR